MPSERGEHIKSHDAPYGQYNSLDALFRRKRGRPPKNRVIEVWNDYAGGSTGDSPQAIFTSFKLPKPSSQSGQHSEEADVPTQTTLVRTAVFRVIIRAATTGFRYRNRSRSFFGFFFFCLEGQAGVF